MFGRCSLTVLVVLSLAGFASAAPLNLIKAEPDYNASLDLVADWNVETHQFTISGTLLQYQDATGVQFDYDGPYNLSATLTETGEFVSGTLTIRGNLYQNPSLPFEDLLTATLDDFGYSLVGGVAIFEFTGVATAAHPDRDFEVGRKIGVILEASASEFSGSFEQSFGLAERTVDTFAIPEPATMALVGVGMAAGLLRRRRGA